MNPVLAYLFCVFINILVGPFVMVFLRTLNKLFLKIRIYKKFFDMIINRARNKVKQKVDKYGYAGLAVFGGGICGGLWPTLRWEVGQAKLLSDVGLPLQVHMAQYDDEAGEGSPNPL